MNLPIDPDKISQLLSVLEQEAAEDKLAGYKPYTKQAAFHATGRYPSWWPGRRFDKPTVSWVAGTTGETVRDTVQRMLIGRPGAEGTGAIPKDAIAQLVPARGIPDLLDGIRVRHESGGLSTIGIKSYLRGRESFQGETLDFLWFDEEPPPDVYLEGLTRTNVSRGPVWLTFTPLTGISNVVKRYLMEPSPDRSVTTMTIDDVQQLYWSLFSEPQSADKVDNV